MSTNSNKEKELKANNHMEKQFIPYRLAIILKVLGFDGGCFGVFQNKNLNYNQYNISLLRQMNLIGDDCLAPTWEQAFTWFRSKHRLEGLILPQQYAMVDEDGARYFIAVIKYHVDNMGMEELFNSTNKETMQHYLSYEDGRLACLEKLIALHSPISESK